MKTFQEQLTHYDGVAFNNEAALKHHFHIRCTGFLSHFSINTLNTHLEFKACMTETRVAILTDSFIDWADNIEEHKK